MIDDNDFDEAMINDEWWMILMIFIMISADNNDWFNYDEQIINDDAWWWRNDDDVGYFIDCVSLDYDWLLVNAENIIMTINGYYWYKFNGEERCRVNMIAPQLLQSDHLQVVVLQELKPNFLAIFHDSTKHKINWSLGFAESSNMKGTAANGGTSKPIPSSIHRLANRW